MPVWRGTVMSRSSPSPLQHPHLELYQHMSCDPQATYGTLDSNAWKLPKELRQRRRASLKMYVSSLASMSTMKEKELASFCAIRQLNLEEIKAEIHRQAAQKNGIHQHTPLERADSMCEPRERHAPALLRRNSLSSSLPPPARDTSSSISPKEGSTSPAESSPAPAPEHGASTFPGGAAGKPRRRRSQRKNSELSAQGEERAQKPRRRDSVMENMIQKAAHQGISYPWFPRKVLASEAPEAQERKQSRRSNSVQAIGNTYLDVAGVAPRRASRRSSIKYGSKRPQHKLVKIEEPSPSDNLGVSRGPRINVQEAGEGAQIDEAWLDPTAILTSQAVQRPDDAQCHED